MYSQFNHPNSEIVEDRLSVYERTEKCALFSSGMSAIATTILAFVRPGDVILHSQPLYRGAETFFAKTLANFLSARLASPMVSTKLRSAWQRKTPCAKVALPETGGPLIINKPETNGFGDVMVQASVRSLGSQIEHDWAVDGLSITVDADLTRLLL